MQEILGVLEQLKVTKKAMENEETYYNLEMTILLKDKRYDKRKIIRNVDTSYHKFIDEISKGICNGRIDTYSEHINQNFSIDKYYFFLLDDLGDIIGIYYSHNVLNDSYIEAFDKKPKYVYTDILTKSEISFVNYSLINNFLHYIESKKIEDLTKTNENIYEIFYEFNLKSKSAPNEKERLLKFLKAVFKNGIYENNVLWSNFITISKDFYIYNNLKVSKKVIDECFDIDKIDEEKIRISSSMLNFKILYF